MKIIREDIFDHTPCKFTGTFDEKCQQDSIPPSLMALVSLIIHGTCLRDQQKIESQMALSIAQLMLFNVKKQGNQISYRHTLVRKPPPPCIFD